MDTRAASLLLVFVLAKAAMLVGHHVPLTWWSPIAYLWQDALVVLVFAEGEFCFRPHPRLARWAYGGLVLYSAINVPVARALSTPLTWPMWRAAGGTLADSMWHYVTWQNAALFVSILTVAALAPLVLRRMPQRVLLTAVGLCVALGPIAVTRVDTLGLERNAWMALVSSALPRISSGASTGDWRSSTFHYGHRDDLSRFRGAAAGRNIMLVSLESTAAQYLGLYGGDPALMPNLAGLARTAIVFDNAYAVYPESIKGLFSILCSTYPGFDSTAATGTKVPCLSLPTTLSENGYRTSLFHSGRFMYLGMDAVIRNRGFDTLADAGDIGGNHNSSFGVDEPSTVAHILSWIDALPPGQPFFVSYLPIAGHHPYETPDTGPFPDPDEFGRYRNALHYGDASLGLLWHGLRERGLDQKTMWIVLGDHGEAFGQHDGNYGHTFRLYEENVHVPFLISMPGLVSQTIRVRQVVSLVDTAPTVLDLAGVRPSEKDKGQSMLDGETRIALFFTDYSIAMLGLRDGPWKFIYELDSGRTRLFDLERDPQERMDLSDGHPAQANRYTQNLQNWISAQQNLFRLMRRPIGRAR